MYTTTMNVVLMIESIHQVNSNLLQMLSVRKRRELHECGNTQALSGLLNKRGIINNQRHNETDAFTCKVFGYVVHEKDPVSTNRFVTGPTG